MLAISNWLLPYLLHTDASMTSIGAAQYRAQEGQTRVEACASRKCVKKKKTKQFFQNKTTFKVWLSILWK